jgi:hypothetical protein
MYYFKAALEIERSNYSRRWESGHLPYAIAGTAFERTTYHRIWTNAQRHRADVRQYRVIRDHSSWLGVLSCASFRRVQQIDIGFGNEIVLLDSKLRHQVCDNTLPLSFSLSIPQHDFQFEEGS